MDRFIKFFTAEDDDDEEEIIEEIKIEKTDVDPVVEARRKEKFSAPLIYDEEDEPEIIIQQNVEKKKKEEPKSSNYVMRDIISPFSGIEQPIKQQPVKPVIHKEKPKVKPDALIPVFSPFYGYEEKQETVVEKPKKKKLQKVNKPDEVFIKEVKTEATVEEKPVKIAANERPVEVQLSIDELTSDHIDIQKRQRELEEQFSTGEITQSIRDLSNMIAKEEQNLKIVEEKTGEFHLKVEKDENSIVDNVEDTMSLDELMSLYEKKFKE